MTKEKRHTTKGFVQWGLDVEAIISSTYPSFIPAWRLAGSANGILPSSNSKLRIAVINLSSVPDKALVNFPITPSLER